MQNWDIAFQKCKISFLPCCWGYFQILSTISLQELCMKLMWNQVNFRSGNIYRVWTFQVKKNLNSKKFAHAGIFCSWYRFWHQINLKLMSQIHDFCRINSIPSIFYGLQFSHYDSSKLLKNFMKSNLLLLWS